MATDSTRAAILDAARQVLFDEGWEALSHQRVAEVAGVGRATVYRHWPQRLQLLQDACSAEMLTIHTQARMLSEGFSNLRLILQRGIDEGRLAPDLNLDAIISRIVGSWVYRYLILDQDITPEMVVDVLDEFLAANLLVP